MDLYKTHWRDVFEKDEDTRSYWGQEIVTGRIKRTFIDLFFYSLLQILVQDSKYAVRAEDKSTFSRVESLFPSYKKFVGSYLNGDKNSLLKEMVKYASVLSMMWNPYLSYIFSTVGIVVFIICSMILRHKERNC